MKPRDILLALSVPLIWGLGFTFAKAALGQIPPILLMAMRFSLTALVLVWFVRPPRGMMARIALIALVSATIQYSLTFTGLVDLDASIAIIVVQLEVPFALLLSTLFLKDHIGWRRAIGMALALGGVVLIAGEPRLRGDLAPLFLVAGGALTWSIGQVMVKTVRGVGGFALIAWVAVFAAPQLFLASYLFEDGQIEALAAADWLVWGVIIYLGLIMTAVGYGIWYRLLGLYRVNQVMPFLMLLPVTTMISGGLLLGETITMMTALGAAIVLAGVGFITIRADDDAPASG
ncbi:MAG: EamA family transporter [Proteobacteria bacterium]|nr:EamA family transporter [Pseudomonadota bacterium]